MSKAWSGFVPLHRFEILKYGGKDWGCPEIVIVPELQLAAKSFIIAGTFFFGVQTILYQAQSCLLSTVETSCR